MVSLHDKSNNLSPVAPTGEPLCTLAPPLCEQWTEFLLELGDYWWGTELTKNRTEILLANAKPGSVVLYAPDNTCGGIVCSGSVVTMKYDVVNFVIGHDSIMTDIRRSF